MPVGGIYKKFCLLNRKNSSNSSRFASKNTAQVDLHLSRKAISTLKDHRKGRQAKIVVLPTKIVGKSIERSRSRIE